MVLSNKKLKQKLREQLAQSLVSSESNPSSSIPPSSSSSSKKPQSFRQLLGAAAHNPGLTKREKRRKDSPLDAAPNPLTQTNDGSNKKRKRVEADAQVNLKEASDSKKEDKKKKKQKKKKKKKGKKKTAEEGSELVSGLQEVQINVQKEEISNGQGDQEVPEKDEEVPKKDEEVPKKDEEVPKKDEEVSKKVYVGGIPYYSTEDDIRSFFDHCGTITEVDCMRFPETGKFRGIAILNYMTEEAAKRALALDGADMGGFFLKVQHYNKTTPQVAKTPAFSPPVIQGYNRIYAGNLSWDITEEDLRNFFSDCSVSSIRFGEDKETGAFKGYAHIDFSDNTSLEKALKLDQEIVCGRPVRITCAVALRKPQLLHSTSNSSVDNKAPTISQDIVENNTSASQEVVENIDNKSNFQSVVANDISTPTAVSTGKMRRRNCYICGERGHISSACPTQAAQQTDATTS